jgi:hypothetical protein
VKLANLDRHPNYSPGAGPLALTLRRMNTLLHSPAIQWDEGQREAAAADLSAALVLMETDVLTLAGRHFPNAEPARVADKAEGVRATIDRVERETFAALPVPPLGREYLVPVHDKDGADWDSLTRGDAPPWGLEAGWNWRRVVIYDAEGVRAHDLSDPALCEDEGCPQHGTPHVCVYGANAPLAMAPLDGFCRCGVSVELCHPDCPHRPRDKYAEPQAPAEHGERLEGALRAAQGPSGDRWLQTR